MQSEINQSVDPEAERIVDDITGAICDLVRTVCFGDKTLYRDVLKMVELKLEIYDAE